MSIKVTKFGGSSLASAEQFKKVKNILEELEKMKTDHKGNISKKDYEKS